MHKYQWYSQTGRSQTPGSFTAGFVCCFIGLENAICSD